MENINLKIGKQIKFLRTKNLGITQEEFSKELGYNKSYLSRIEAGKHNLTLQTVKAICQKLGVTLSEFFESFEEDGVFARSEGEEEIKFIDLFAGIGGIRRGFEQACEELGFKTQCVFTSEIKESAIKVYKQNYPDSQVTGDITKIGEDSIPDFDFLLAGFPCQAFSSAGKRKGFEDTRGTLFFDVARILKKKKPFGFILENVEGLVTHDRKNKKDTVGQTLTIILNTLEEIGYKVTWNVLNASDYGVPQNRKRIYITGTLKDFPVYDFKPQERVTVGPILEKGLPVSDSKFVKNLLRHYDLKELEGKKIKDKRGGKDNIHSWDLELKGKVSQKEKDFLNVFLKERRKKKWAVEDGIDWMDGMALTKDQIKSFYTDSSLDQILNDLTAKGYLKREHPKKKEGSSRIQDEDLPLGYNLVAGKMSFDVNEILAEDGISPTLVAMDMEHIFVIDGKGIRKLSLREGLRLFGFPDSMKFDVDEKSGYDLLGNTVVVPVIKLVSESVLNIYRGIVNENDKQRDIQKVGRRRKDKRDGRIYQLPDGDRSLYSKK